MNGILLLNKPKGMTSHDCVNRARRIFKTKKVGHTGTLDPSVTGVLPICINDATKIIQFMEFAEKEYIAEIAIGYSTTTEDRDGEVITQDDSYKSFTRKEIEQVLVQFLGEQQQVPPMISSVKVNGKKLYEYAREGKEVERPVRTIHIHELELLEPKNTYEGQEVTFKVRAHVSKGTYIRTLAVDIGKKLGFPAHMKELVRTKSGHFSLEQCVTLEEAEQGNYSLVSLYEALQDRFMVQIDDSMMFQIKNGQKLKNTYDHDEVVFVDQDNDVLAIYRKDEKDATLIKPVRVLINN